MEEGHAEVVLLRFVPPGGIGGVSRLIYAPGVLRAETFGEGIAFRVEELLRAAQG